MSALRISSDNFFGIFKISIILNIIFLERGAFTVAPVVENSLIFLGYSTNVKTMYLGLLIGKILIKEVRFLSLWYPPSLLISSAVPVFPPMS